MLIHELTHVALSLLAGLLVFFYLRHWLVWIVAVVFGVLVDADHLFDYFLYKGNFSFDLNEFLSGVFFDTSGKVYVLLHAFEYSLILFIAAYFVYLFGRMVLEKKRLIIACCLVAGISLFLHLMFDTLNYKPNWPAYSITYRIMNNFDHDQIGFK